MMGNQRMLSIAKRRGTPTGALAGEYVGARGGISLGVGVGGNVLFGGSNRAVALQRLSVERQAGIDVSLRGI